MKKLLTCAVVVGAAVGTVKYMEKYGLPTIN